jgi:predicted DNA-binding transcriptional regulator AlpA
MSTSSYSHDVSTPLARRYLRPKDAAVYTGIAVKTLEALRRKGDGPQFSSLGRCVFYDTAELDEFMASRRVRNTAEASALGEGGAK